MSSYGRKPRTQWLAEATCTFIILIAPASAMALPDMLVPWPLDGDTASEVTGGVTPLNSRFPNVMLHPNSSVAQNEMSIALNPSDRQYLLAGSNAERDTVINSVPSFWPNMGSYFSGDGGGSWFGNDDNPPTLVRGWDPVVGFNASGVAYFSNLELRAVDSNYQLALWQSSDNGDSWGDVRYVPHVTQGDKNHMAVDQTSSSYSGDVYLAFTEFGIADTAASRKVLVSILRASNIMNLRLTRRCSPPPLGEVAPR